ncbi:MAG: hypothetical protein K9M36_03130 [Candidatus Pacebacteria bacterium]|nr:hypothetical protein [Candidatus Paceibacterota bacterium]
MFLPLFVHADALGDLLNAIYRHLINPVIAFIFALATLWFIVGVIKFLANGGNEQKKTEGKQHMLWGLIGMFVMVSVFGIMQLIVNTLGMS